MQTTYLNFEQLFQKHWSELYCYAYNIVREKALAEDIVQDVFTDYWKRQIKADIPRAFLYRAVKNQCAKYLIQQRLNTIQIEKLTNLISELDDTHYQGLKEKLFFEIKETAQKTLPIHCLKIFELRFYEQYSYKEIASKLQITESTVKNQINKALRLLKNATVEIYERHINILVVLYLLSNR